MQCLREERAIHASLRHPHVCALLHAIESPASMTLVLERCDGGSLVDALVAAAAADSAMPDAECRVASRQLLDALSYCHARGVYHRDVKLANLCWHDRARTRLVLLDFGYASTEQRHSLFAGSAHFAAPELHGLDDEGRGEAYDAAAADVWSAGVVVFAMLATRLPFDGPEDTPSQRAALRARVCAAVPDVPLAQLPRPAPAVELVQRLMVVDATQRASAAEALALAWLKP